MHSCAGIYSVVEFEVLEPATVSLPEEVNQLIVLNRAPISLHSFEKEDVEGLERNAPDDPRHPDCKEHSEGLAELYFRNHPLKGFINPLWLDDRREDTT